MGKELRGVIPAVTTPLHMNGSIDYVMFRKQLEYLIENGVDGLFISGTTGEGAYLSLREKLRLIEDAERAADGNVFICTAVLKSNIVAVKEEISCFNDTAADYCIVIPPFYYSVSQDVVREHFLEAAECSAKPVIMYNIPSCVGNRLELDTVQKLKQHPNIIGIKDSSGDFVQFSKGVLQNDDKDFVWIQGEDYLDASSLLLGAGGMVTGLANVWATPFVDMYEASCEGNHVEVFRQQKEINRLYELFQETGYGMIPSIKAACEIKQRGCRWMRQTGMALKEKKYQHVEEVVKKFTFIEST